MAEIDKQILTRLLAVMERFRKVRHTMPVHLVEALLRVGVHEGKSVIAYARDSGVTQSVMSRHLLELGSQFVKGEPGLGLVDKRHSPHSLREFEVYLTPKGKRTLNEVIATLEGRG
jgi:DNA-binding MarR family transcriptional regulator